MKIELSKKLEKALNEQINMEISSAYIYYGMLTALKKTGAPGSIHWMANQAHEEMEHAEEFISFVQDMGGEVKLEAIEPVTSDYPTYLSVWEAGLKHEKEVSASILDKLALAIEDKNYVAEDFLRKYAREQAEEEKNFADVIALWKMAGDDAAAIFKVDSILGKRA